MIVPNYELAQKEKEFEKYHGRLRKELNHVCWHFTIWKYLQKLRGDYLRELNQAPAFFGLTIDAHFLAIVLGISRLFDKRRDTLTIYEFLDYVEQNLCVFANESYERRLRAKGTYNEIAIRRRINITHNSVAQDRQKVQSLPIGNIRKWRHKIFAHLAKEIVLSEINVAKEYPVNRGQIDEIIKMLDEVLNQYCAAYDASSWGMGLGGLEGGIQGVVDSIRFKIQ